MTPEQITAAAVESLATNPPVAPPADTPTTSGTVENTPDVTVDSSTTQDDLPADTAAQAQDGQGDPAPTPPPKKPSQGVQKRIDELVRDREEANRRADRLLSMLEQNGIRPDASAPAQPPRRAAASDEPRPEQFSSYEEYLDARTDWRWKQNQAEADKAHATRLERISAAETQRKIAKAEAAAASKYEDYDEVVAAVKAADFPGTKAMADVIAESDNAADLLYWLGSHRDEAERISRLSPVLQARELTRVEASLTAPPPAPRNRPSAPPPPRTLNGGGSPTSSLANMPFSDLRKWAAEQQRR